jgi:uncharacterized protein
MRPSEALAIHREKALAIIAQYPVSNPRIFGSVARGEDTEESDLDIIVDAQSGCSYFDLFRIEDAISNLLNAKVDVHTMAEFGERSRLRVEHDLKVL